MQALLCRIPSRFRSVNSSSFCFKQRFPLSRASSSGTQTGNASTVSLEVKEGIAIVRINDPSSKVNTLSRKLNEDFANAIEKVENDPSVKAAVLISGKSDNFIAGADINMLSACTTAEELSTLSRDGQIMLSRLASGKPKVAAINGSCLGGGLEVALACHYRIASENPKTVLGLPEVMLGLLPGAGGTQRLPALIGAQHALDPMLTGKNIKPQKAKKLFLVDQLTDPYALEDAAIQAAKDLASGQLVPAKLRDPGRIGRLMRFVLEKTPFGRSFLFSQATKEVMKQTNGKYPAPLAILEVVRNGIEHGMETGLRLEAKRFGELGMTPESKALIGIFHGQTACKKNRFGEPTKPVKNIAILGAGLMGAGIAQVTVDNAGLQVFLKDTTQEALARGEKQVYSALAEKVKKKSITSFERDIIYSRIATFDDSQTQLWNKYLKQADVVLEAVPEKLELKHIVLRSIEEHVPSHCVFATNTSALPIKDIASAAKNPERVIGMHYFSPVDKMPLLEIITHDSTAKEVAAAAVLLGLRQGKTVIVVKDVPGFYVNRSLGPYMVETMALLSEGVDPQKLDKALKNFGMPVGPISLADEVGMDVALHVQSFLSKHLGVRMEGGNTAVMKALVEKGFLGRKAGKGFYLYPAEKSKSKGAKEINQGALEILQSNQKEKKDIPTETIQLRMISRFVNEAIFCLQDGIVGSASEGDIGAVFGIGFPPFLGGPFRFVDQFGVSKFHDLLNNFADKHGPQFTPAPLLTEYAKAGKKFHSS